MLDGERAVADEGVAVASVPPVYPVQHLPALSRQFRLRQVAQEPVVEIDLMAADGNAAQNGPAKYLTYGPGRRRTGQLLEVELQIEGDRVRDLNPGRSPQIGRRHLAAVRVDTGPVLHVRRGHVRDDAPAVIGRNRNHLLGRGRSREQPRERAQDGG